MLYLSQGFRRPFWISISKPNSDKQSLASSSMVASALTLASNLEEKEALTAQLVSQQASGVAVLEPELETHHASSEPAQVDLQDGEFVGPIPGFISVFVLLHNCALWMICIYN